MATADHPQGLSGLIRSKSSRPLTVPTWFATLHELLDALGSRILQLVVVLGLVAGSTFVVYATGGLPNAYAHLAYIPILLAAYYFGLSGAIGIGVLAGIVLGPLSAFEAFPGPGQTTASWLNRMVLFVGVGMTATLLMTSRNRNRAKLKRSVGELYHAYGKSLQTFASLVALRDEQTSFHCERVALNACALGEEIRLSEQELTELHWAGILHDLGKISTPGRILLKPGALTDSEYAEIKKHAAVGADILAGISPRFLNISEGVRSHHERWDGTGYPQGLAGRDIPISGRILAIVDVFEAITSERPYRSPMPIETALHAIRSRAGTHFDPDLVYVFLVLYNQGRILVEGDPIPKERCDQHPLPGYATLAEEAQWS